LTLQWRLTLLFFLLTAGAVAALGVGAYVVASDRVYGSVDDGLSARSQALTSSIVVNDRPLSASDVDANRRSLDSQAALGADFRIAGLDGTVLYASPGSRTDLVARESDFHTARINAERFRILVRPLASAGQPMGFVEVTSSLSQADSSLAEVRSVLIVGAVAVSAISGFIAFYITGRAVQPVLDVSELAREIERTANFTRRLPEAGSAREMREMSSTFNRMIERVEKMIQAQRSFLSDTSHELRRPLTVLRTNIDVINDPALSSEDRSSVQQEMSEVADSMSRLLSELLMLSRQEEELVQLQPVNLSAICASAVKAVSTAYPEHRYEPDLEPDVWTLGDHERLLRAVTNLLQNAAAYMERAGEIDLSLRAQNSHAVLRVTDTGPGMAPEDVEHAFDRFYRGAGARRARPDGLGLGLAIVKQVVDSHSGFITIESCIGQGTVVTVELPTLQTEAPASSPDLWTAFISSS